MRRPGSGVTGPRKVAPVYRGLGSQRKKSVLGIDVAILTVMGQFGKKTENKKPESSGQEQDETMAGFSTGSKNTFSTTRHLIVLPRPLVF